MGPLGGAIPQAGLELRAVSSWPLLPALATPPQTLKVEASVISLQDTVGP